MQRVYFNIEALAYIISANRNEHYPYRNESSPLRRFLFCRPRFGSHCVVVRLIFPAGIAPILSPGKRFRGLTVGFLAGRLVVFRPRFAGRKLVVRVRPSIQKDSLVVCDRSGKLRGGLLSRICDDVRLRMARRNSDVTGNDLERSFRGRIII